MVGQKIGRHDHQRERHRIQPDPEIIAHDKGEQYDERYVEHLSQYIEIGIKLSLLPHPYAEEKESLENGSDGICHDKQRYINSAALKQKVIKKARKDDERCS